MDFERKIAFDKYKLNRLVFGINYSMNFQISQYQKYIPCQYLFKKYLIKIFLYAEIKHKLIEMGLNKHKCPFF